MSDKVEDSPSTKLLRAEIERFLNSKTPEVLSIRGAWGAGKTFAWNRFLKEAHDNGKVALEKYAYVSLFGLQSLDDLKYAVFESTVRTKDIGTEPSLEALQDNTTAVLNRVGRRSVSSIVGFFKGASDAVKTISFLSVSDQIICIDDMERKGQSLRTQDVLGLVSMLRERRKCKVVLILNENELEEADRKQLDRYHEKVIDSSLLFAPTSQDCVDIALPGAKGPIAVLARCVVKLDISNIRVIKKIERLVLQAATLLEPYDKAVLEQAIQTLTLLGWAHFGRNSDTAVSLIDYVIKHRDNEWFGAPDPENLSEDERKWSALLDRYGFTNTDDFDLVLLDAIRNGSFDTKRMEEQAKVLNQRHKTLHSQKELENAWALFHDSFDDNENEVIDGLIEAYTNCIQIVTPSKMESLVGLLKSLGRFDVAKECIQFFMAEHANESRAFFDLENHPFRSRYSDPDLAKSFKDKLATFQTESNPVEILERIDRDRSWSSKDISSLCALTVTDFKMMFKTERAERLRSIVRAALGFERILNRGIEFDPIINNARKALEEIAAESKLNARRVSKFLGPPPAIPENAEFVAETTSEH